MAKIQKSNTVAAPTTIEAQAIATQIAKEENIKTDDAKYLAQAVAATEAVITSSVEVIEDYRKVTGIDLLSLPVAVQNQLLKDHFEKAALAKQLAETEALKASKTEKYENKIEFYSNPEFKSFGITFPMSIDFPYLQNADNTLQVDPLGFKCKVWEFKTPLQLIMTEPQRKAIAAFLSAFGYDDLEKLDLARLKGEKAYKESLQRKSDRALKKAEKVNIQTDEELKNQKK